MKILHVLDHSLPIGSGYSYRSRSVIRCQQRLRLDPSVLTSPKQGSRRDECEIIDAIPPLPHGRGRRAFAVCP